LAEEEGDLRKRSKYARNKRRRPHLRGISLSPLSLSLSLGAMTRPLTGLSRGGLEKRERKREWPREEEEEEEEEK